MVRSVRRSGRARSLGERLSSATGTAQGESGQCSSPEFLLVGSRVVAHNGPVMCFPAGFGANRRVTAATRYQVSLVALATLSALLIGCEADTNQGFVATATPYPVRSPVAMGLGRSATAAADVEQAIATGAAAIRSENLVVAATALDRAGVGDPRDLNTLAGRALARAASGDLAGAAADLDAAIDRAPDRADLYYARAEIAGRQGELETAAREYGAAITRDPGDTASFVGRGRISVVLAEGDSTRYQAALGDFGRALALDPSFTPARLARAELFLDRAMFRGDPTDLDRALETLDGITSQDEGSAARWVRIRVLAARGDLQGAEHLLEAPVVRTIHDLPSDRAADALARTDVALAARDWGAAAAAATGAIQADPFDGRAYRALAVAELNRGHAASALAVADRLLSLWREDGPGLYLRGLALDRLGREIESRESFMAARARLVASPVYQARIAQALGSGLGTPGVSNGEAARRS